jgi:hypothetical protein
MADADRIGPDENPDVQRKPPPAMQSGAKDAAGEYRSGDPLPVSAQPDDPFWSVEKVLREAAGAGPHADVLSTAITGGADSRTLAVPVPSDVAVRSTALDLLDAKDRTAVGTLADAMIRQAQVGGGHNLDVLRGAATAQGAKTEGEQFQFKSPESLSRKIAGLDGMDAPGAASALTADPAKIAENVARVRNANVGTLGDVQRYTIVYPEPGTYVEGVLSVMKELSAKGYAFCDGFDKDGAANRVPLLTESGELNHGGTSDYNENYWRPPTAPEPAGEAAGPDRAAAETKTGATFNGLCQSIVGPDDQVFELQHHTDLSYLVKTAMTHFPYDLDRQKGVDLERHRNLTLEMIGIVEREVYGLDGPTQPAYAADPMPFELRPASYGAPAQADVQGLPDGVERLGPPIDLTYQGLTGEPLPSEV